MSEEVWKPRRWQPEVERLLKVGKIVLPTRDEFCRLIDADLKTLDARNTHLRNGQLDRVVARIQIDSVVYFACRSLVSGKRVTAIHQFDNLETLSQSGLDIARFDPTTSPRELIKMAGYYLHPGKAIKVFELAPTTPQTR